MDLCAALEDGSVDDGWVTFAQGSEKRAGRCGEAFLIGRDQLERCGFNNGRGEGRVVEDCSKVFDVEVWSTLSAHISRFDIGLQPRLTDIPVKHAAYNDPGSILKAVLAHRRQERVAEQFDLSQMLCSLVT